MVGEWPEVVELAIGAAVAVGIEAVGVVGAVSREVEIVGEAAAAAVGRKLA